MPTYAILGATGKVGFATSSALRGAGVSVRAIVHDASKATALSSIGCEIAVADLHDVDSLSTAFQDADAVQVVLPLNPGADDPPEDMRKGIECLIKALEAARPARLLAISDYGAHVSRDIGMPSIFHSFEKRLNQLDGHKLILRSSEHIENWASVLPVAQKSGTLPTFYQSLDAPFPMVSARNVGVISANLLILPVEGKGTQVVHVEGPHRYSANDVAEALGKLLDRNIVAEQIPRSQWENVLKQGMSSSLAHLLIKTNDTQNEGGLIDVEPGSTEVRHGTTELKEVLQGLLGS